MPETERIGRYELIAHLAAGGMGQVYLARSSGPGGFVRHVVLKTLDLPGTDEDEAVAMFLDEARLLGLLHHQHISPVYEVGKDDEGQLFLVMDYIHGRTAHHVWTQTNELGAALPIDFSLTVAAAAASGLHYAHTRRDPDGRSLRIVHRDVSLSNLMIGYDGGVKLIDFGIAKATNRSTQTQAGFIKGKIGYMAPEQLRGHDVDARTDVFSLGIVLYELTTMRRAFREESDRATMDRIRTGAVVPPKAINPDFPAELERIILRALRVDPRERYPDAETMLRELDLLGHQLGLVLGDAAIVEVMSQLFEQQHEPWQKPRPGRPLTELDVSVELVPAAGAEGGGPRPRPGARLRAATEAAALQLETPPQGIPKRPSAFSTSSEGVTVEASASKDTGAVTILRADTEAVASLANDPGAAAAMRADTETVASLANDPGAATSLRSHLDVRPRVSNDTDGVTVVSAAREAAAAGAPARATALDPPAPAPDHAPVSVPAPGPRSAKLGPASSPPPKAAAPVSAPLRRRTAIIGWAVFALLAAGAIAGGAYVLQGSGGSPAQANAPAGADRPDLVATPPPGSTPPSTAPPPPIDAALPPPPDAAPSRPPDAAPSSTQVNLRIKTTPSDATVLLDGKRLGRTPYTGTVEAAPGTHVLKIRKRGYIAVILDVELSGDVTREVALQRTKSEPAPP